MHFWSLNLLGPALRRRVLSFLGVALWAMLGCGRAVADDAPVLVGLPATTAVYAGQNAVFNVTATGTPPLTYQWQFMETNLPAATGSLLVLYQVTTNQAGAYQVIVANSAGSVTSAPVSLVVLDLPTGSLRLGEYSAGAQPEVAAIYTARGNETAVSFSLTFNTNTLANPRFLSALPLATLTEDRSQTASGLLGVTLQFVGDFRLGPGEGQLGKVVFDLRPGAVPMAAGLSLTNVPVAPVGPLIDGTNAIVTLQPVLPQFVVGPAPVLDFQSGLFLQRIQLAYPGVSTQALVQITVGGLGVDSQGLPIGVQNAFGIVTNTTGPQFAVANLAPGETRVLRVEFYVSDLVTVPTPFYTAETVVAILPPGLSSRVLAVDRMLFFTNAAFPEGAFLIEFPTEIGRSYYIQYAPSPGELNGSSPTLQTARPSIPGTGSRVQWIDGGPPKTDSAPTNGARFYRVILSL